MAEKRAAGDSDGGEKDVGGGACFCGTVLPVRLKRRHGVVNGRLVVEEEAEGDFQAEVCRHAKTLGWKVYHTVNPRGSTRGFPDLVLVRRKRVLFIECKRNGENPSQEQDEWLEQLEDVTGTSDVWRPEDRSKILMLLA